MVKTGAGELEEGNLETEVLLSIILVARNVGSTTDDVIAAKATFTHTWREEILENLVQIVNTEHKLTVLDSRVDLAVSWRSSVLLNFRKCRHYVMQIPLLDIQAVQRTLI